MAKKDANEGGINPAATVEMVSVAYHDGPNAIGFLGRWWQRDVAQSITADEWAAMQSRGDFEEYQFTQE